MSVSTELPDINVEEFRKVVKSRRSVRRFLPDPIPEAILDECLDLAMLAPNSSNLQPWEFYVVKSDEKRKQMVAACLGQNAAKTAPVLIAIVARTRSWKENAKRNLEQWPDKTIPKVVRNYYSRLAPFHYSQGPFSLFGYMKKALGLFLGLKRAVPRGPYSNAEMAVWAAKSTALAAENLMLALRAHGYDSCPMEGFDACRVNKIIHTPRDGFVIMVLAVGKRATDGIYNTQFRFDRSLFVHEL